MLSNNANIDKKVNNIFMRERANQKYYNCRFINSPIIVDGDFEKSIQIVLHLLITMRMEFLKNCHKAGILIGECLFPMVETNGFMVL